MGVRISWLMAARNSLFAWFALSARSLALAWLSTAICSRALASESCAVRSATSTSSSLLCRRSSTSVRSRSFSSSRLTTPCSLKTRTVSAISDSSSPPPVGTATSRSPRASLCMTRARALSRAMTLRCTYSQRINPATASTTTVWRSRVTSPASTASVAPVAAPSARSCDSSTSSTMKSPRDSESSRLLPVRVSIPASSPSTVRRRPATLSGPAALVCSSISRSSRACRRRTGSEMLRTRRSRIRRLRPSAFSIQSTSSPVPARES